MRKFLSKAVTAVRDTVSGRRRMAKYDFPEAHRQRPNVQDSSVVTHYRPTGNPPFGGV